MGRSIVELFYSHRERQVSQRPLYEHQKPAGMENDSSVDMSLDTYTGEGSRRGYKTNKPAYQEMQSRFASIFNDLAFIGTKWQETMGKTPSTIQDVKQLATICKAAPFYLEFVHDVPQDQIPDEIAHIFKIGEGLLAETIDLQKTLGEDAPITGALAYTYAEEHHSLFTQPNSPDNSNNRVCPAPPKVIEAAIDSLLLQSKPFDATQESIFQKYFATDEAFNQLMAFAHIKYEVEQIVSVGQKGWVQQLQPLQKELYELIGKDTTDVPELTKDHIKQVLEDSLPANLSPITERRFDLFDLFLSFRDSTAW